MKKHFNLKKKSELLKKTCPFSLTASECFIHLAFFIPKNLGGSYNPLGLYEDFLNEVSEEAKSEALAVLLYNPISEEAKPMAKLVLLDSLAYLPLLTYSSPEKDFFG